MSMAPQPSGRRFQSLLIWLLLFGLAWVLYDRFSSKDVYDPDAVPRVVTPRGDLAEDEKSTIALFRNASPSVAYITTLALRRDMFSLNTFQIPQGTGSGFIWNREGHIITNFHVIKDANRVMVTLSDRSQWQAKLVGAAPDQDLAVLFISAPRDRLTPIPVGTSSNLLVGQKVFAIGNPFGLDQTLTTGIISALGREIDSASGRTISGVIQTDAAINPGNSGGPLLDSAGRLLGVNTAIFSPSGSSAGIGFAVPVDTVNRVVPELIRHGRVIRPGLGVQIAEDTTAQRLGVSGVLIIRALQNGAASAAGLRGTRRDSRGRVLLGDIIVGIEGDKVGSTNDLLDALEKHKVGDRVTVHIIRDERPMSLPVTLQAVG